MQSLHYDGIGHKSLILIPLNVEEVITHEARQLFSLDTTASTAYTPHLKNMQADEYS